MPPESPGEGPPCLFQLLGAPGIHPWAGGRLPPVSASTRLLLCVLVSPLLCLIRTLSLGLGLSPSRRASSQTFTPSQLQRPRNFRGTVFNPGQHPSFRDVGCFCLIFFFSYIVATCSKWVLNSPTRASTSVPCGGSCAASEVP